MVRYRIVLLLSLTFASPSINPPPALAACDVGPINSSGREFTRARRHHGRHEQLLTHGVGQAGVGDEYEVCVRGVVSTSQTVYRVGI